MYYPDVTGRTAETHRSSEGRVERTVSTLICVWMVILPWLIGGWPWWAEAPGTVVGAVAFFMAVSTPANRRVLWRFPVFWIGLAFLILVLCQALNPWVKAVPVSGWEYIWVNYAVPHLDWLPSGVSANYFDTNTWRALVYWLGPWLLACAWWTAVRRRGSGRRLGWVVLVNAVVIALLTFVQEYHPSDKALWFYTSPGLPAVPLTFGPFNYRNAAAEFLYLSLGAGLALAGGLQARARTDGRDSGLTWAVLLGCALIFSAYFNLGSRAGLAIGAAVFLFGLVVMFIAAAFGEGRSPAFWVGGSLLILCLAGLVTYEIRSGSSWTWERAEYIGSNAAEQKDDMRSILHRETIHMIKDHPWLGFGGGSYAYISPDYFRADGYFVDSKWPMSQSARANHAHSDWLQLPMEYGFIGAGLLLAILLYLFGHALWLARWLGAAGWITLFAILMILVNATVDFPAYNAAVLTLFSLLLVSTVKTAMLEKRRAAASK
jgi:O-antigen ligase